MRLKLNKRTFFQIHSWIGIKLSILFFIVCFSGTLAVLSHEMDWLFFSSIRAIPQEPRASHAEMAANLKETYPNGYVAYWSASNEPYLCDIAQFVEGKKRYYVFINPYTAEVQGRASLTFQRFFRDLHYYLFIPFQVGHFTVLFFGFLLLFSLITALVFYTKWWNKFLEFKRGRGALVTYRSLHRLVGLWSLPFALLFSITGIWYFVERANVGNVSRIANTSAPKVLNEDIKFLEGDTLQYELDYERAVAAAQVEIPDLEVGTISPPLRNTASIYLTGKSHVPLVRYRANRVYLDPVTYEPLKVQKAEEINTITYLNDIADPLHFGYWGGLPTKILWFLGGLAISGLTLTGIWIALKRQAKKRSPGKVYGPWRYINWLLVVVMLVFMHGTLVIRYSATWEAITIISLVFGLFGCLVWYVFDFKLRRALEE
ncbi:MAG: PepSY-associated TM helix domain-containing protein [Bacteroidota bacterium]